MSGTDNSPQETIDDTPDFLIEVEPPPALGFLMLYHANTRVLLQQHSSVIKTYLALGLFTDPRRESEPSLNTLAELLAIDRRSVMRALNKLEEAQLIERIRSRNGTTNNVNRYKLLAPGGRGMDAPRGTGAPRGRGTGAPQTIRRTNVRHENKDNPSNSPQSTESEKRGVSSGGVDESGFVSKSMDRPITQEHTHPYWLDEEHGERRLKLFRMLWDVYPKHEKEPQAMRAWREKIGRDFDGQFHSEGEPAGRDKETPAGQRFYDMGYAIHWYADKCRREATPQQFIKSFENYIREDAYLEAPREAREART